jgi:hypothetical protein
MGDTNGACLVVACLVLSMHYNTATIEQVVHRRDVDASEACFGCRMGFYILPSGYIRPRPGSSCRMEYGCVIRNTAVCA